MWAGHYRIPSLHEGGRAAWGVETVREWTGGLQSEAKATIAQLEGGQEHALHENEPRLKTKERQICVVHKWRLIWSECVQTHTSAQVEVKLICRMWCSKFNEFMSIWSTLRQSHNHVRHRRNSKLPSYLPWMINPLWYTTSLFDAYTSHLYAQFWSQGCDMEFDIYMRRNKTFWIFTYNLGRTYEHASHWREHFIVWGQISRISTSTS